MVIRKFFGFSISILYHFVITIDYGKNLPVFGPTRSFDPVLFALLRRIPVLPEPGPLGGPEQGVPEPPLCPFYFYCIWC